MTTDKFVCGMHHLNITQIGSKYDGKSHLSHPNYEIDLAGEDTGIDFWFNKMPNTGWKAVARFGNYNTGNTYLFHPVDLNTGAKKKVMCADGVERFITLAMTHSAYSVTLNKVYKPNERMYTEGKQGYATGNHLHLEVAEGLLYTKKKISGAWNLDKMMDITKVMFVLDGYTTVMNTQGLVFKHCSEVEVKQTPTTKYTDNDLEQINMYGTSESTRKIATSFHVYRVKGQKVNMTKKEFMYGSTPITAIQLQLNEYCDLDLSYKGSREWLPRLHNDWYKQNGFEEIMAMNAGYFIDKNGNYSDGQPIGAVAQNWQGRWSTFKGAQCVPSRNNGYPTLSWDGARMELHNLYASEFDLSKYAWLCGVGQSLVINGKVDNSIGKENGRYNQKNCATAIGFNHNTRTLTFMINSKVGINTLQRSYIMESLGCDIAVQLDGGGSAQLEWLKGALN